VHLRLRLLARNAAQQGQQLILARQTAWCSNKWHPVCRFAMVMFSGPGLRDQIGRLRQVQLHLMQYDSDGDDEK